ncbi:hypothetical protein [Desulfosporosinus hippei]|uniref:Uncharacterized protein n=1 Tax=Desulfosporosinus hippei DSM 8344 TaxID=1121419 RepID=A0A1G8KTC7_9FIRM|nr:hypothetical protein [Desulfosporosinus hippei]SDI46623.1 hypothetical protein SAMN05443529_1413 [Desulfosporosinus hippei DSM 8344]
MNISEYNSLQGDIRMKKIELAEAENILKNFDKKWIYIKLISNSWESEENSQTVIYSKFKVRYISIDNHDILVYGIEDDDRLVISKNILVQSECTYDGDEIRFIQKSNNKLCDIYIKGYLPTSNFRLDEITHSNKNIIITEGKTDWKHLKNALSEFKKENKYKDFGFEFFEYEDDVQMGNSTLLNVCKYQALFKNEYLKVFVFDSDDPAINNEHEGEIYKYYGNNVYSLILPIPPHRIDTPLISIENYYTDDEIKIYDEYSRRLYLAKEFNRETSQHLEMRNVYALNIKKDIEDNHIIDNKVYKINSNENIVKKDIYFYNDKTNIALSKNNFAEYILKKVEPFDRISINSFSLVFDVLSEIQNDSKKLNDDSVEISNGVYLTKYGNKRVLDINISLKMENALEFKNTNILQCVPTVSDDRTTLYLELYTEKYGFRIPITINKELIEFLECKLNNSSNRIELHVFDEDNEVISNKELFQGDNSSVGIHIIRNKIFS